MRCLPLGSKKTELTDGDFFWYNVTTGAESSFNYQPSSSRYGCLAWRDKFGRLHRDNNLPAILYRSGTKRYWQNGQPSG